MAQHPGRRVTVAHLLVGVAAAITLAACGGSSSTSGTQSGGGGGYGGGAASSSSSSAPAAQGTPVTSTEKEFSITLSRTAFTPGTYTFTVQNKGTFPHNLTVAGPGVQKAASPTVDPGKSGTVTVTLSKGTYELWCSVDSHKERGMDMKITVG